MQINQIAFFMTVLCSLTFFQGCKSQDDTVVLEKKYSVECNTEYTTKSYPFDFLYTEQYLYLLRWKDVEGDYKFYTTPLIFKINKSNLDLITISQNDIRSETSNGGILIDEQTSHFWLWAMQNTNLLLYEYDKELKLISSYNIAVNQNMHSIQKVPGGILFAGESSILKISNQGVVEQEIEHNYNYIYDLYLSNANILILTIYNNESKDSKIIFTKISNEGELLKLKEADFPGTLILKQASPSGGKILFLNQYKYENHFYILDTQTLAVSTKISLPGFKARAPSFSVAMPNDKDIYIDASKADDSGNITERKLFIYQEEKLLDKASIAPLAKGLDGIYVEGKELVAFALEENVVAAYSFHLPETLPIH